MKQLFNTLLTLITFNFIACADNSSNNKIASIPEASGISYCEDTKTLIVANDEGSFYELTSSGKILSEHKLGKYDLEGVVCEKERLMFAVEEGAILEVNRKTLKKKELKLKGKKFKLSKKAGIEGIAKSGDLYYLSIQAKKKKDSKLLIVKAGVNYAKVVEVIEHGIIDSAGLEFHEQKFYVLSDKKDKLYIYDLKREKILKKIKLPKFAQEGVTFDNNGFVYFADDDGAVFKYSKKDMKIK
ncbi:MAG: Unknown protein [uncultured Sulfurovum sp.]|uniref:Periplasmic nitrate reductase component NapL n=1 Tax=uncultured Sulfurovum sp. TaxID=269237 RepID=A0A6S6TJ42_9BACT|nr:MAG: Unknown protein [uncultured Sulfurovum sp.]